MTVVYSRLDPLDERDTWLTWRRQGIGGSDIAAICGLSPFASPPSVYLDKLGMLTDSDDAEHLRWGRLLEAPIAREFETRTGLHVIEQQVCAVNTERPWERATLDGLIAESPTSVLDAAVAVLEIKNVAAFGWDMPPYEYVVQVQWQLGITGLPAAYLAVLHGGRKLAVYVVPFDVEVFGQLSRMAERFWHQNVIAKMPPPIDGAAATTDALKDAYRDRADGTVLAHEQAASLADAWMRAKALASDLGNELARIENEIRAVLAESTVLAELDGTELVTWKPQNTAPRFDRETFARDHPILAAQYTSAPGTARVLRATKALKARTNEREPA